MPLISLESGTLYVVGTPIGNLGDLTRRSQEILSAVDLVLCEDTRVTGLLLKSLEIDRPKESFHQHNTMKRLPSILRRLQTGQTIALVSDRGMPAISDPGRELVEACHRHGIKISVIPGVSAVTAAFSGSGYSHPFVFWGFLPARGKERRQVLERVAETGSTQIFYESPHRLQETLEDLGQCLGSDRAITIARELTKPYEEFWQGQLAEALGQVSRFRGELVLLLAPGEGAVSRIASPSPMLWQALDALVQEHIRLGRSSAEAIRLVAAQFHVARRTLYDRVLRQDGTGLD